MITDLKEFLDTHGIPAPQPSTRDKLIASVRRNARVASLKTADVQASASASASAATETLSEQLLSAWSDSRKSVIIFFNEQPINKVQKSRNGPTRMVSRFPKEARETNCWLSLVSTRLNL